MRDEEGRACREEESMETRGHETRGHEAAPQKAFVSSSALKNGKRHDSSDSMMTPADQMSMAVVCGHPTRDGRWE